MNKFLHPKASLVIAAVLLLPLAHAQTMSKSDDKAGNDKDACVKEARAAETKALADAKMGRQIGEARKDAVEEKREADYKVAAEKCESMAGDAKGNCMASAKAKFGKS